ncbi:MAG: mannonate dehydratase [Anaerolineales bacterium]
MKLGLAFSRSNLSRDNLKFARQCGVTHIVVHYTFYENEQDKLPERFKGAYGFTREPQIWSYEELRDLRQMINDEGMELEALENFNPGFWYDVILDGPRKAEQMANLKQLIRNVGRAGIPVFGYAFNLMNVWGHTHGPWARGGAVTGGYHEPEQTPIPEGMVWNMVYNPDAPDRPLVPPTHEQMWGRLEYFLKEIVPVAEEAGVIMAGHPDDPPLPVLRGAPRLVTNPDNYQRLLDIVPSPNSQAELCVGTVSEMAQGNVYDAVEQFSRNHKVAYVHLRNVRGKVPHYTEVFIDEGDTDLLRVLRILHKNGYQGVITPDHTPLMNTAAPWQTGFAFALGYIRAAITLIEQE